MSTCSLQSSQTALQNIEVGGESSILAFATKGTGSNEEKRLRSLLQVVDASFLPYDKSKKFLSFWRLLRVFSKFRRRLIVMEGTGIAGGLACLLGRLLFGHRYVFSSGDAVGPFVGSHYRLLAIPFGIYERILCQASSGFIGWTPYLVGRAMTFGAPRGVTAPGWVIGRSSADAVIARQEARSRWGVSDNCIVFGIAGALVWSRRRKYCYGLELVRAIRQVSRDDIAVVVIGDGSGLDHLRKEAGSDLGKRVFLPGRVPLDQVMENLCGFDVASLPQSMDAVGAFRYTTKISEYRSLNLPIVTSRIPASYDLDLGMSWRLPGAGPWEPVFIDAMADLMMTASQQELHELAEEVEPTPDSEFCRASQIERVTQFLQDLSNELFPH